MTKSKRAARIAAESYAIQPEAEEPSDDDTVPQASTSAFGAFAAVRGDLPVKRPFFERQGTYNIADTARTRSSRRRR